MCIDGGDRSQGVTLSILYIFSPFGANARMRICEFSTMKLTLDEGSDATLEEGWKIFYATPWLRFWAGYNYY
jgi:hypothetical protein